MADHNVRVWIFDEGDTPQRFPLPQLFLEVRRVTGSTATGCEIFRADGYGPRVAPFCRQLDAVESIVLSNEETFDLIEGVNEWFFDIDLRFAGSSVRFGIHDSSALYVVGPEETALAVAGAFGHYERDADFR